MLSSATDSWMRGTSYPGYTAPSDQSPALIGTEEGRGEGSLPTRARIYLRTKIVERAMQHPIGETFGVRLSFLALFLRSHPHSPAHTCHLPCCHLSSAVLLTKEDFPSSEGVRPSRIRPIHPISLDSTNRIALPESVNAALITRWTQVICQVRLRAKCNVSRPLIHISRKAECNQIIRLHRTALSHGSKTV